MTVVLKAARRTRSQRVLRSQRRRQNGTYESGLALRLVGLFFAVLLVAELFFAGELTVVLSGKGTDLPVFRVVKVLGRS